MSSSSYIELHAGSAFSFLRGGSLPEQLATQAADLGLSGLAICDRMGVYGAPRFVGTANEVGVRAIHGAELLMEDGSVLPLLVKNRTGYANRSVTIPGRFSSARAGRDGRPRQNPTEIGQRRAGAAGPDLWTRPRLHRTATSLPAGRGSSQPTFD
jgi:DNA polymerase III alpha subunit